MSKRCPHVLRIRRDALDCDPPLVRVTSRCYRCGAWFSFGPSDETPVAVEVRAAEIAEAALENGETAWRTGHPDEWYGWLEHKNGTEAGIDGKEFQTGYLARVIYNHEQEITS